MLMLKGQGPLFHPKATPCQIERQHPCQVRQQLLASKLLADSKAARQNDGKSHTCGCMSLVGVGQSDAAP